MNPQHSTVSTPQFIAIVGITAVLFFLSLIPLEVIPEIQVDIDQKAFFIPFLLAVLLPVGRATLAVGLGMALGEGIRDLMEGYELDDPFGFVGYVACVLVFGYMASARPLNRAWLALSAVVGAGVQSAFEAATLLLFGSEAWTVALYSGLGNTFTHGVLGGAIPLVLVVPLMHGRFERLLGVAPKGAQPNVEPLRAREEVSSRGAVDGILCVQGLAFRYPATERPALDGITFGLKRGEVLGIVGPLGAGKTTLCLCLTGLAPQATGGDIVGSIRLNGIDTQSAPRDEVTAQISLVAEQIFAQLTQVRALDEVAAPLMNRGMPRDEARQKAREVLRRIGMDRTDDLERRRTWELSDGEQRRLVLAAALIGRPDVLLLDGITGGFDPQGREHLRQLIRSEAGDRSVLLIENDPDLLLDLADRVGVLVEGRLCAIGPAQEILADRALMEQAGLQPPLRVQLAQALGVDAVADIEQIRTRLSTKPKAAPKPSDGPRRATIPAEAGAEPILAMEKVSFCYVEGVRAADRISLRIESSRTYGVLGSNGAGKTTLAQLALGLLRPESGRVLIRGRDAASWSAGDRAAIIGLSVQNPDDSISERTVADEIAFPLRRRGHHRDKDAMRRRVVEVAEMVRLTDRQLKADPTALSFGQRKLITIATALVHDPALLILDEPMVGLDGAAGRHLREVIARLQDAGKSILILDHGADFMTDVADHLFVLEQGRIVADGPPSEVFARSSWDRLSDAALAPPRAARLSDLLGLDALTADDLIGQAREIAA
jgi:energy-coupling factor transport system ATP-binding protein